MPKKVIEVRGLTKTFEIKKPRSKHVGLFKFFHFSQNEQIFAIRDLSFHVHEGEKIAFINPRGKQVTTSLLRLRHIDPSSSSIVLL